MTEELMVGTVGWDYSEWAGTYYPDDMPEDWRFGYYSNDFRSVLVPGDHFPGGDLPAVGDWLEDCDASFRFVVEIPATALAEPAPDRLTEFMDCLGGLDQRTAGYYLNLTQVEASPTQLVTWLEPVTRRGPLCVNARPADIDNAEFSQLLSRLDVGLCWSPDVSSAPAAGGRLMLALTETQDPKQQRHIVEALERWAQASQGTAGVFFGGVNATNAATQTRIIAEMLGI